MTSSRLGLSNTLKATCKSVVFFYCRKCLYLL
nr:MAG TPA: hypothetical protein [Bacteriophage sp.]